MSACLPGAGYQLREETRMKNKLINFIAAMGIPVSGITTQGAGCTGICGSCSLNCAPGIVALLLLAGKAIYKRYHGEVMQHE